MADLSEHFSYHRSQVCDDDLYGWLLELIQGPEWHKQAACRGNGAELFFAERGPGADNNALVATARIVCAGCPVRAQCLETGLGETHGVWGGTTPRQRRRLRVQRRRAQGIPYGGPNGVPAKCGTDSGYYRHRRLDEEPCAPCRAAHSMAERSRPPNARNQRFADRKNDGACPACSRYNHEGCKAPCACDKCHPRGGVAS